MIKVVRYLILLFFISCQASGDDNAHQVYEALLDLQIGSLDVTENAVRLPYTCKGNDRSLIGYVSGTGTVWPMQKVSIDTTKAFVLEKQFLNTGLYTLDIYQEKTLVHRDTFTIQSHAVTDMMTFTGPLNLTTDQKDSVMYISYPRDSLGNVYQKTTQHVQDFEGNQLRKISSQKSLIGNYSMIPKQGSIGEYNLRSQSIDSQEQTASQSEAYTIKAGSPDKISLVVQKQYPYADGRKQTIVKTLPVKDLDGNIVVDGSHLTLQVRDSKSGTQSFYESMTVNGVAQWNLQNPQTESEISLQCENSNILRLNYQQHIQGYTVSQVEDRILVSEIITSTGEISADGVMIRLFCDCTEEVIEAESNNGKYQVDLGQYCRDKPTVCQINIGGIIKQLEYNGE